VTGTMMYEAVFLHARACPLYNGDTRIIVFERDDAGEIRRALGTRVLPDDVTEPTDVAVEKALAEMGCAVSRAEGDALVAQGLAGWRMLVKPLA
jgi:hypothetical protein